MRCVQGTLRFALALTLTLAMALMSPARAGDIVPPKLKTFKAAELPPDAPRGVEAKTLLVVLVIGIGSRAPASYTLRP